MPRMVFAKEGNAVWISHLDLMRLFQRAFKRAGLKLTHTQGFNQRPSVSIALPLSVGIESQCELLDFDLEGETVSDEEIVCRLNESLIDGIRVLAVYPEGKKLKHLTYMDCSLTFEYDLGVTEECLKSLRELFGQDTLTVEKKGKNGVTEQDIIPMIRSISVSRQEENTVCVQACICCQNPTLNPMQLCAAVEKYLPNYKPNFVKYKRMELYDSELNIFR